MKRKRKLPRRKKTHWVIGMVMLTDRRQTKERRTYNAYIKGADTHGEKT